MKSLSLFAFSVLALSLLAGCSTTSSQCGCLPANCCSWDFYKECDLIEGKTSMCQDLCGQPDCQPGVVVSRCYAVPVDAPEAPAAPDAVEEAPAAPAAAEGDAAAPIADFGLPPAGR